MLLSAPETVDAADVVLMEGTYGDRNHRPYDQTIKEFVQVLEEAHRDGGNVLVPAFAVGRTQEVLYHLARLQREERLKQAMVVLDSPMAIEVTHLYQRHRELLDPHDMEALGKGAAEHFMRTLHFLRLARTTEESMAINRIQGGAIIIAGSGMCEGGRILHHLEHNLWRRQAHVVFVGFQAQGTLGRHIIDGAPSVRLYGHDIAVRAKVHTLGGFSAHAGQSQLIDWAKGIGGDPRFYFVHGEPKALQGLQQELRRQTKITATIPSLGDTIEI